MTINLIVLVCTLVLLCLLSRYFLPRIYILWKTLAISTAIVAFVSWAGVSYELAQNYGTTFGVLVGGAYLIVISLCMYALADYTDFHNSPPEKVGSYHLNPERLGKEEDWVGNNAAFRCPVCQNVYIVTTFPPINGKRKCPDCGKSEATIAGGKGSGGSAKIDWET